ncbi:class A beta-lactamase [Streptomyces sp. WI04-05B]|uniref:class A beta-lactamase n=1 Tax=Streptomyces TaxID=1883 RepID=UPI0029B3206E|nr:MULTISPECIES: class A beta-lactamase [unclassified Streptomyces]MDX2540294.1 class A beta-lactamase [Streptomyces sp. WI04-05B]MDX2585273.1 class A beta-lactamase [Streptomyces sp. WI04-05A]
MDPANFRPTRRTLLTALTVGATTTTTLLTPAATAHASTSGHHPDITARLHALEARHGARVGVFAHNLGTRQTIRHRADERFPVCSLFKTLAAAAVLRDLDRGGEVLSKRVHYTADDLVDGSAETEKHLAEGMTVAELADVAIRFSDNTAGNLLLRELGGPTAITRFARSVGDRATRLDRWETELNSAEPWRITDTTTPYAIGRTYARLVLGDVLNRPDRELLTHWLLTNTTSGNRFRLTLPPTWTIADKTGAGAYGTNNNVGIAWTRNGTPLVLAVQTTKPAQDAAADHPLVAETARLLGEALG